MARGGRGQAVSEGPAGRLAPAHRRPSGRRQERQGHRRSGTTAGERRPRPQLPRTHVPALRSGPVELFRLVPPFISLKINTFRQYI